MTEWRNGQTARGAAKSLCSCMAGKTVQPSPASAVMMPKGAVRPPKGAARGQVFGVDELREPGRLAKLRAGILVAQRKAEHEEQKAAALESKLKAARSDATQRRLRKQLERVLTTANAHRQEEQQLQGQLTQLSARLGWAMRPAGAQVTAKAPARRKPMGKVAAPPAAVQASPQPAQPNAGDCACKLPGKDATEEVLPDEAAEQWVNQFAAATSQDRKRA